MGLSRLVGRLAATAPVPVFPLPGAGGRDIVRTLRQDERLWFRDSPRSANILLICGALPPALVEPAIRLHDQLSGPRATVWLSDSGTGDPASAFPGATRIPTAGAVEPIVRHHRELTLGNRASEPFLLPDADPAPWRGVGPYGQGGKGMTGGVPYGRPMAQRAPDRDGLELDQVPLRVGPFFPAFPPGLALEVRLQGDLIQEVSVGANPFVPAAGLRDRGAIQDSVSVMEIEMGRARHHLHWLADALRVHGLEAESRRLSRRVATLTSLDAEDIARLGARLDRVLLGHALAGVGPIPRDRVRDVGLGPVARASGVAEDTRASDPTYAALGFEPIAQRDGNGDARERLRQRVAEAVQALELAGRAGDRAFVPAGSIEPPRGPGTADRDPSARLLDLLPELLNGLDWGDAVTTIVSLDLDLEEAASG